MKMAMVRLPGSSFLNRDLARHVACSAVFLLMNLGVSLVLSSGGRLRHPGIPPTLSFMPALCHKVEYALYVKEPSHKPIIQRRNSKMRLASALKAVEDLGLPDADYKRILEILVPPAEATQLNAAVSGLGQEDDFALSCRLMNTTTHLVKLDQTPLIPSDVIIPDFFARFQAGCRVCGVGRDQAGGFQCLIEVKTTEKPVFEMKASLLNRRLLFAEMLGLPLLLAVRFLVFKPHPTWTMVRYSKARGKFRVKLEDMKSDLSHTLWDDYLLCIFPCSIVATWDDAKPSYPSLESHGKHLQKLEVSVNGQCHDFAERSTICLLVLDNFYLKTIATEQVGTEMKEQLVPQREVVFLREIPLSLQTGASRGDPLPTTSATLLSDLLGKDRTVDRDFVESVASVLMQRGILGRISYGEPEECLSKWKHHFSPE